MVAVECRTAQTHVPHKKTGDIVSCSAENGLECLPGGVKGRGTCFDYEMRVLCDCGARLFCRFLFFGARDESPVAFLTFVLALFFFVGFFSCSRRHHRR